MSALLLVALAAALMLAGRQYLKSLGREWTDDAFVEGTVVQVSPRVLGYVTKVYVRDNQHVNKGDVLVEIDGRDLQNALEAAKAQLAGAAARLAAAEATLSEVRKTADAGVSGQRAGLERAKADLEAAQSRIALAESQRAQANARVTAAAAAVEQSRAGAEAAEAEARRAAKDLERYEGVFKTGGISASQLDQYRAAATATNATLKAVQRGVAAAEAARAEADAGVRTAEQAVLQAQSGQRASVAQVKEQEQRVVAADVAAELLAKADAERARAAADLAQLTASVNQAELDLSYARVVAATDGVVTKKSVEPGNFVRPGQAILGLVSDEKWVVANFKETQLAHMRPGQPVEVRVDAYPGLVLKAKVESVQRGTGARFSLLPAENATGNYVKVVQRVPVKLVFDGPVPADRPLSLGMSVIPEVKIK